MYITDVSDDRSILSQINDLIKTVNRRKTAQAF